MPILLKSGLSDSPEEAVENQLLSTDTTLVSILQIRKPTYFKEISRIATLSEVSLIYRRPQAHSKRHINIRETSEKVAILEIP